MEVKVLYIKLALNLGKLPETEREKEREGERDQEIHSAS